MNVTLYQLYQLMYREMGPQGWWPAESKNEIVAGAILVQNTNWQNVDYSLANLRRLTDFDSQKIAALSQEALMAAIRPSGFYQNKSKGLLDIFAWLTSFQNDFDQIKATYGDDLRKELLRHHSIGEETADALLLYVFDEKVFIADTYSQRLFKNLGITTAKNYRSLRKSVSLADFSLTEAQEFHGLIVNFGKDFLKGQDTTTFMNSFLADTKLVMKKGMIQ